MAATAQLRAIISAQDNTGATFSGVSARLNRFGSSLFGVSAAAKLAFTTATTAATTFAIKSASDFEQSRVALETMVGGVDNAKKLLREITDFARKTPFQLPEVVEETKKLLAYGITQDKVLGDMKTLGDIAAGVGKDKLRFLTLAFGQVATKGKLMGQEIRQFTESGVHLVDQLAKSLGKTREEITKMSEEGDISFEQVRSALEDISP